LDLNAFYRPGRHQALLGGDFYDAVQTAPDRLELVVGDVCGHDVDGAALGVELRVAWRALTLARVPEDVVFPAVEQVLITERHSPEVFATLAGVTVDLGRSHASVRLAGHPPPLLVGQGRARPLRAAPGLVLGVLAGQPYPVGTFPLEDSDWALLVYTDGLIEGRVPGGQRLGVDGLCRLIDEHRPTTANLPDLPAHLVSRAEDLNDGPLSDDVAMLLITKGGRR
jgi:serine phosphatase RsbU (regulator of sigma subunit)